MKRAAIYCRISDTDERTPKVEIQEQRCRALADRFGYAVQGEHVYVDDGISAFRFASRPAWAALMDAVASGAFDVVLATEESRFTRQPPEKFAFEVACVDAGVVWHTELEGLTDPATSDGEFMSAIRAAVARQESRRKAERQRAAFDARVSRGEPLWGGRVFGYELDRKTLRHDEAAQIRWATELLLGGGTLYSVIKQWNEDGLLTARGKSWSYAQVRQVLLRPRNAGLVLSRGEVLHNVQGAWETIITPAQHETLKALLSDASRSVSTGREPRWLCAGLARCGVCGAALRSAGANYKGSRFTVYRCSSRMNATRSDQRHASHRADSLDDIVANAVASALVMAPRAVLPQAGLGVSDLPPLLERLAAIRHAKENLVELSEVGGVDALVRRRLASLNADELQVEAKIRERELASARGSILEAVGRSLLMPGRVSLDEVAEAKRVVRDRFNALSIVERRVLVRELLEVTVNPGRDPARVAVKHRLATSLNEGS